MEKYNNNKNSYPEFSIPEYIEMLFFLHPSNFNRDEWLKIGMSCKSAGLSFEVFHGWCKGGGKDYKNQKDCFSMYDSIKAEGGVTVGTLIGHAKNAGYFNKHKTPKTQSKSLLKQSIEHPIVSTENKFAREIWDKCIPAHESHGYINSKKGSPENLRIYPKDATSISYLDKDGKEKKQYVQGCLAVPAYRDDKIQFIQFIHPDSRKDNLGGTKLNDGWFTVGVNPEKIYISEGLGHAWTLNQLTGFMAIHCFGSGQLEKVSTLIKEKYPESELIIVSDKAMETKCEEIAAQVNGFVLKIPDDLIDNYDINDYYLDNGSDKTLELINTLEKPVETYPLDIQFADQLSDEIKLPEEIVEGLITVGACSMLYGDSNCGKTYFVVDMCICIARGIPFLGRQTQQGLILYLAVESPASVMTRLQVYHYHYGIKIPNFVIVKNPINLFDGEDDTQKIIKLIKMVEKNTGKKVLLIVGDTLARLSSGGNECAGQDMGVVVKHVDKIRNECDAHLLLIHHSGKNASAKGRGWSGLRAAVDTEIEVTETLQGKCAEITKQRDLNTKSEKIGFKLLTIPLDVKSNFGKPATGAIVLSDKVPEPIIKFKKRTSPVYYAIFEFVKTRGGEVFKVDAMKELSTRFKSSTIYDQILNLVDDEKITDEGGLLRCI